MSDNSFPPIIIDNGSGYIKAGFSTDKLPSVEEIEQRLNSEK